MQELSMFLVYLFITFFNCNIFQYIRPVINIIPSLSARILEEMGCARTPLFLMDFLGIFS